MKQTVLGCTALRGHRGCLVMLPQEALALVDGSAVLSVIFPSSKGRLGSEGVTAALSCCFDGFAEGSDALWADLQNSMRGPPLTAEMQARTRRVQRAALLLTAPRTMQPNASGSL
mmetsp:Transcript_69203/g.198500  ORF Transcript_69203/g.198500 Transcript_69203/m.198500 type:complete len:115 (-) Transcript_69203:156-500(-)